MIISKKLASRLHQIGRRGTFLLFLALLDLVYAYALAYPSPTALASPAYVFLAEILPLWVWASLWVVAGLSCLYFAFQRQDAPGYAVAMFIKILWALVFLLGWLAGVVERGYLSAAVWGAFAGVLGIIATWPDPLRPEE